MKGTALPTIVFEAKVFSGNGAGRKFIELPWVERQIQEKLGFSPYFGTLNLLLSKGSAIKRVLLEKAEGIEVAPQAGYYSGVMFKAQIGGLKAGVIIPKVPNYPRDVLEVIAPVCLREHLKLADSSLVAVTVEV